MNKKNNQRFLNTELKLEQAFLTLLTEKELSSITVSDICDKAQTTRVTFYLHYTDINDIVSSIEEKRSMEIVELFKGCCSLGAGFVKLFEYIKENKEFYSQVIKLNDNLSIFKFLFPKSGKVSINYSNIWENEEEASYHNSFFNAGVTAVTMKWIRNDCKESPEQMAKILYDEYDVKNKYNKLRKQSSD